MPHAVTPEPPEAHDDIVLADANATAAVPSSPPGSVQNEDSSDEIKENVDVDMQDHGERENEAVGQRESRKPEIKTNATLDEMFDDDLEDDEFSSSAPQSSVTRPAEITVSDDTIMRQFYQRLFPFRYLFQWLNHSPQPTDDFAHREFAFTLAGDVYLRYQSFKTGDLLRKQCMQQIPTRFEIGPVYTSNPRERKTLRNTSAFKPRSKELVFDIDMTDYDEIRMCCSGAKICNKCWSFITMAIKVVDEALREDFGFKHILWVYSGRRGAHAWVCDKRARELSDDRRRAIAGYMELLRGGNKGEKRVNVKRPLHPHIERSLGILRDHFEADILEAQDPFAAEDQAERLLNFIPDAALRAALLRKWDASPGRSSAAKWADINALAESGASANLDARALKEAKQDVVLEYTYPRLDAEVSKKLNHLLKSPFCVHPGTGRVCVPIDTAKLEEFDPFAVPTVTELLAEIDAWHVENDATADAEAVRRMDDWEKTRLKGYVDYFRGFVTGLLKDEKAGKRGRDEGDAMEF